jgi:membrane fusion protein, multidrug efflux system
MDVQVDKLQMAGHRGSRSGTAILLACRVLLPIALLAGAFFAYQYFISTKPVVAQHPAQERARAVHTVPAIYTSYQPVLTLYGETVTGRRVDIRTQVAGEVVRVGPGLREGGEVATGDLLFEIDNFEYQGALVEARANLSEAAAKLQEFEARAELERDALGRAIEQLELARRDLARAEDLNESGTLSEKTVDDRALVVSQREQGVEQRENNLQIERARAEQQRAVLARLEWRVRKAERDLAYTQVTAPFDAYVRSAGVELGRTLGINDVAVTLLDRNWVEVRVTLSDRQYGRIMERDGTVTGRSVTIRWDVGVAPLEYAGTIERVAAEIDSRSGGVEVYARVEFEPGDRPLRAGAFVEVDVQDLTYDNIVRLPVTALYGQEDIYIVVDGRLEKRVIEPIGFVGSDVLVRGSLNENERVVVTRLSEIGEGIKVTELTP